MVWYDVNQTKDHAMIVDPEKLLRHLEPSVPHTVPDIKVKGFHKGLPFGAVTSGTRWKCPLHQDQDGSLLSFSGTSTLFRCENPSCRFKGDAVSLVSMFRKIPLSEALALFGPGSELSDCLQEPLRTEDMEAYLDNAGTQSVIKAYLARCSQALKKAPEKAGIRVGMSTLSLRLMHPDVGLFIPEGAPRCLQEFTKPKYRKSVLILYPYTLDGEVSKIEVLDATNPVFRHTVVVTHPNIGVFGEDAADGNGQVVVAERPEVAAALYAIHATSSTRNCFVASFQGYPLPESFRDVTSMYIVSSMDAPASTEFLLRTLSAPLVKPGRTPHIKVSVVYSKYNELKASDLAAIHTGGHRASFDIHHVLAKRLSDMVAEGQSQRVLDLLEAEQVPAMARSLISEAAERQLESKNGFRGNPDGARGLIEFLKNTEYHPSCDLTLANGKMFHCGRCSISAVRNESRSLLCNVGISVENKILSREGEMFCCTVTHSDDMPVVKVKFSRKDFTADRMAKVVQDAFAREGVSPYVAFYSVQDFSWPDIMSRMAEHCAVSMELETLGVDSSSSINLPGVVVRADGSVVDQTGIFTMPEAPMGMYSGISYSRDSTVEPYYRLLDKCGSLMPAAFTLGLMHVVYQMTYGMFRPGVARNRMMRHFFYVETEPGVWQMVFRMLHDLLSGGGLIPTVNYSKPEDTFSRYAALGCLPLLARIPTMGGRLASSLESSGMDLLGIMDPTTAVMTTGRVSAAFVMPMNEDGMRAGEIIDSSFLDELRESFIPFLSKFVTEARIDTQYRSSSLPCMAAYKEGCRILGVDEKLPSDLVMGYFPGIGMSGMDMFCDMLHRMVVDEEGSRLCIVDRPPRDNSSFTRKGQHIFVLGDCVLISNAVLDIVGSCGPRRQYGGKVEFNRDEIVSDMARAGMLAEMPESLRFIDSGRCWCMTRKAWESRIVRPPIVLDEPVSGTELKIGPIER